MEKEDTRIDIYKLVHSFDPVTGKQDYEHVFIYSSPDVPNVSYLESFFIGAIQWTRRNADRLRFVDNAIVDLKQRERVLIGKHRKLNAGGAPRAAPRTQSTVAIRSANEAVRQKAIILKRWNRAMAKKPRDPKIRQGVARAQANVRTAKSRVVRLKAAKVRAGLKNRRQSVVQKSRRLLQRINALSRDIKQLDSERTLLRRTRDMFSKGGGSGGGGSGGIRQKKKKKTRRRRQKVALREPALRR